MQELLEVSEAGLKRTGWKRLEINVEPDTHKVNSAIL
jgi:hypothetical protein